MKEIEEDLFEARHRDDVNAIVITTNGFVKNDGRCVMGRGCAKRAKELYPGIDLDLGSNISQYGNHVYVLRPSTGVSPAVVSFPVKDFWSDPAEPWLIERSCLELVELVNTSYWNNIWMVRPGCGAGQLSWEEVKPIIKPYFNDRFTICQL